MDPLVKPNKRWIIRATKKKKPAKKLDHIPSDLPYFLTRKTLQHECNVVTTDSHRHTQTAMRCRRKQAWQLKITGTEHTQLRDHTSTHTHTRAQYLSELHSFPKSCCGSKRSTYTEIHVISVHFSRFCIRTDSKPCTSFQAKPSWPWQKKKRSPKRSQCSKLKTDK